MFLDTLETSCALIGCSRQPMVQKHLPRTPLLPAAEGIASSAAPVTGQARQGGNRAENLWHQHPAITRRGYGAGYFRTFGCREQPKSEQGCLERVLK
jgi:hypothetical protein